jgi:hypothetical protein
MNPLSKTGATHNINDGFAPFMLVAADKTTVA